MTVQEWCELIEEHMDDRRYQRSRPFLESVHTYATEHGKLSERQIEALTKIFESRGDL